MGRVRSGIGGWVFAPWRGTFYPDDLPQKRELEYAGQKLATIEINGTFYGSQKPESFRKWAAETPEDFVFSLKAPRFATHRKTLADAGSSIERFVNSGLAELGEKLGPILWQFPPFTSFEKEGSDEAGFSAFLDLLPKSLGNRKLRHVFEMRHRSFADPRFLALLAKHGVALAEIQAEGAPELPTEPTADFLYLRLKQAREEEATGYSKKELGDFAKRLAPAAKERDVFVYFINGAKVRAPFAAMAFAELAKKG